MRRLNLALLALLLSIGSIPAAVSREGRDHDRARAALQAGEILPLSTVLERLGREQPGQVLEVELERDQGRWIYELKLLEAGGLVKLKIDARSGEVLERRERRR